MSDKMSGNRYINMEEFMSYLKDNNIRPVWTGSKIRPKQDELPPTHVADRSQIPLRMDEDEFNDAVEKLVTTYPRIHKRSRDPPISGQNFGLFSWIPAQGAKPDSMGYYGSFINRGNFDTLEKAQEHAEMLVNDVDSYHEIIMVEVGSPVPLVTNDVSDKLVKEIEYVRDIDAHSGNDLRNNMLKKREELKKESEEIKRRTEKIEEENRRRERGEAVPLEGKERLQSLYFKKGHLIFSLQNNYIHRKKFKDSLVETLERIEEEKRKNPEADEEFRKEFEAKLEEDKYNVVAPFVFGEVPFDIHAIDDEPFMKIGDRVREVSEQISVVNNDDMNVSEIAKTLRSEEYKA